MEEDTSEISTLRGDLAKKVVPKSPPSDSKLRGSLVEKEKSRDPNFAIANTLNIEKDEDGPPIARSVTNASVIIGFASVADGLGGSGARHVIIETDGKKEEKSMAYVASRKAQEAAQKIVDTNPQALTGTLEEIRVALQTALEESYSTIISEASESKVKGNILKDFPTTFSTAVVQETSEGKKVMLFWAGDSPLFVFTPNDIFTTYVPGAGDALMDTLITPGHYGLTARQLDFLPDTPLLIVAASDGVLKLGTEELKYAKDFILDGVQNNEPDKIGDKLRYEYQRRKGLGQVEADDTTIAIVSSMKPGEISKLSASAPVQTIL